ncbi:hypothetical protein [Thermocoleostomius sinensis]|uniref:Uncharacterized protein n=1 Tax=Thermocoleostomius sinensis A174 TaxID=2016057 RepID=A0A9E8Z8Q2_9CYAN|nr:hypothetical protein [Thermocoleostomius sinensis]WAL58371.1 hypothetical protein OXH18_14390 [Thermocoleostomius sinensis A174]
MPALEWLNRAAVDGHLEGVQLSETTVTILHSAVEIAEFMRLIVAVSKPVKPNAYA